MKITLSYVQSFALSALKTAQRDFNKHPNSTNFDLLSRAMLAHQQAQYLKRTLRSDANVQLLLDRLSTLPLGDWSDAIVKAATGMTCRDILLGVNTLTQA